MSEIEHHLQRMAATGSVGSIGEWNEFSNRVLALRARVQELQAARSLLPNMPISGAMRREWERFMLRPFDSAAEDAFRAMLRAALTEKGGESC